MTGWKRAKCSGKKDARVWRALSLSQEAANFALASKAPAWYAVMRNSLAGMGHVDKVPDCILEQRGRNAESERGDSASERNWPAGRNPRLSSRTRLGGGALARSKELHRPLDKVVHTPDRPAYRTSTTLLFFSASSAALTTSSTSLTRSTPIMTARMTSSAGKGAPPCFERTQISD